MGAISGKPIIDRFPMTLIEGPSRLDCLARNRVIAGRLLDIVTVCGQAADNSPDRIAVFLDAQAIFRDAGVAGVRLDVLRDQGVRPLLR